MARSHRFHLDRGGHSVTVQLGRPSSGIEVLVDGKVVAYQRGHRKGVTVLTAELPGDPPQPITVRVDRSKEVGDIPLCVMETDHTRYPMPRRPLATAHAPSPTARTPLRPMRWMNGLLRRRLRHLRVRRR